MNRFPIKKLADEIEQIYTLDQPLAESLIEACLEKSLIDAPVDEKLAVIAQLIDKFKRPDQTDLNNDTPDKEVLSQVFSLLLGRNVSSEELTSSDLMHRMAESLNTVFNILNQLVMVINKTLFGESVGEETIRQVIDSHLQSEEPSQSLETYLGQINKAFLISQKAFKTAARDSIKRVLDELDPDKIEDTSGKSIKFGPFKKAELYEIYYKKFRECKNWFESDRFMVDLLREFEKNCQKLIG